MIEVSILDSAFVKQCRSFGANMCLYDNSLYYFAGNGYAVGFREKRPYTALTKQGYWRPSGTRAKPLQLELDDVNLGYELMSFVRANFDSFVSFASYTSTVVDMWQTARVHVLADRIVVQFPDAHGRIVMTNPPPKTGPVPLPIMVMPELVEKLLGICEAADLPLDFDPYIILSNAYNGTCLSEKAHIIAAHGYAVVLLLQNKLMIKGAQCDTTKSK